MRLQKAIILFLLGSATATLQAQELAARLKTIDERIAAARATHNDSLLAQGLAIRTLTFYNNGLTDSVIRHVPEDLKTLRELKRWDKYYESWSYLINTYIYYSNSKNTALREMEAMRDDALARQNVYGQGIAYYAMGNVYLNTNDLDESAAAYLKSLNILSDITPLPYISQEVYSYYGDVLNAQKQYRALADFTVRWKAFLERFIAEKKLDPGEKDILWFYYEIACAQAAMGLDKLSQAEESLRQANTYLVSEDNYEGRTWLFEMAQLRLQQGRLQEALNLNNHRLSLLSADEDKGILLTVYSQRADIMSRLGHFKEAASLYQAMYLTRDSISGADTKHQLNEMSTQFHVDELEREQERMKMEQEREQFRLMMVIVGIVVLALTVFIIFRIRSARRLKRAHEKLQATHEELQTAYDQLEETTTAKERIESDLRIARNIQMGMVPHTFPDRPDLDIYASMTPAKEVGGDLYGYVLQGDKLYFCLGDVSGKGVPASLFMAQATRLFRTLAAQQLMPADICTQINEALSGEDNETSMFVTMFLGLVDLTTGHLDFCNAGHNPPVLFSDGHSEFVEMIPNAPIGLWPGLEYEGEEIADITGRPFFVYSDGLNEAENRQQEQFTDERLLELLEKTPFESCQQTIEMLRAEVEKHRDGAEPNDDLTMLCVKIIKPTSNN